MNQDLIRLNDELKRLVVKARLLEKPFTAKGRTFYIVMFVSILGVFSITVGLVQRLGSAFFPGLLMTVGSLGWFFQVSRTAVADAVKVHEQIGAKQVEIERAKHRIAEQRGTADS